MQQQPLAFTLVKTVVSARDEGKVLSPALATAWDLLHTELSPAHRVIAAEVKWSPTHQDDLRFVIEGVRKQFDKDPDLEGEFLAFLAEVEPFGEGEEDASILPMVLGITSGSSIAPPVGEVAFAFEGGEELTRTTTDFNAEPEVEDLSLEEQSLAEVEVEQPAQTETLADEVSEQLEETPTPKEVQTIAVETGLLTETSETESVEDQVQQQIIDPLKADSAVASQAAKDSTNGYWPFVAGAVLLAAMTFGIWQFAGSSAESDVASTAPITLTDSLADNDNTDKRIPEIEPSVAYTTPNIARLSEEVDSLRRVGDYASALTQQLEIAELLEVQKSPPQEIAQAFSELAILYSAQDNLLQAIVEQRKSLGFARQAFAKTDPALGRSHLKLATFYMNNMELHMARAHLQQARQIFGQAQELVSPTDLQKTDQIEQQILKAS